MQSFLLWYVGTFFLMQGGIKFAWKILIEIHFVTWTNNQRILETKQWGISSQSKYPSPWWVANLSSWATPVWKQVGFMVPRACHLHLDLLIQWGPVQETRQRRVWVGEAMHFWWFYRVVYNVGVFVFPQPTPVILNLFDLKKLSYSFLYPLRLKRNKDTAKTVSFSHKIMKQVKLIRKQSTLTFHIFLYLWFEVIVNKKIEIIFSQEG